MKAFVVLAALLVSSSAFAENIIIKKNDPLFLQYIESTTVAIQAARKDMCKFGKTENGVSYHDVALLLRYTNEIRITSGAAPRLVFDTSNTPYAYADRAVVTVITTSDYQKVVSVEVRNFHKTRVNVGNLLSPKMVDGSQRDDRFFCKN